MASTLNSSPRRWRGLYLVVIAYLLLASSWWAVLLYNKNREAFEAKSDLLRTNLATEGRYLNEETFQQNPDFRALLQKYRHQVWMIYGETAVFVFTLIIGVGLINRGYQKEMRAANQQRNFLLSITHELKSPLASIRLVLETLLKRQLPQEQIQYVSQKALSETDRLNKLVSDLLLSAKLETAYQPIFEPLDLRALVREQVGLFTEKYPQALFHLYPGDEITLRQGDREGLQSVVQNLLENAVKYADGQAFVEMRIRQENNSAILSFADRGIGVNDSEKLRIFGKFYRVGNEDTRKTKGAGLGLFIVDQIVRAHGGRISAADNKPKGTVFTVEIPC